MRLALPLLLTLAVLLTPGSEMERVQAWMETAFYPVLLTVLLAASLGVPIPEDIPLIAAGVLLRTHPGIASWPETLFVALVGVLTGDIILYSLGRRWGPGAVTHRSVRWIITPDRFTRFSRRFRVHGTWFCFFGRFVVGVRAAMCVTAGATRFAFWRFFLADLAGALLSVPLFLLLGYWFASVIPTLQTALGGVQFAILASVLATLVIVGLIYRARRRRREPRRVAITASPATGNIPALAPRDASPVVPPATPAPKPREPARPAT